ncbi:MAG TPA: PAS domain S-box protein [Syntrophothermus lipocalidus]|uniref:Diguanylate cyclase and metal dependent phosphohydrolase n=1 Tax=Syntrophothermus lipocalidus (strain DSM 12680 / TGB-C1) TaxID=643648 RepID=D7CKP7_SYNLT|nr:PAS domain S-box protein [Syntrophothermus lipocalidus]ADI01282.1 diguanylate cyclase and metal dependent phosphohydrolase [Syntrophothermus lipocalidus DSM 12680]HHV76357.1 PAS domain S-box protein [Syntrophothermus lipocalidus]
MQPRDDTIQTILDTIEDGFFEVDLAGNMLVCNRALARIIGYPVPELLGKNYTEYMKAETAQLVYKVFSGVFLTREPVRGFEWELLRPDGSTLWVETSVSPVINGDGRIAGFRGVLRDISARKKAEQLLDHQLQFEKLLAHISQVLFLSNEANLDSCIELALAKLGEFVGADRSYLFLFSADMRTTSNTHEWCAPGISPQKHNLQKLPAEVFSWWMKQLYTEPYLYIPSVSELPPEAEVERQLLEMQDIQSLIVVSVPGHGGNLLGFLGFDAVREKREWHEDSIRLLSMAAQCIAHAIQRCRSDRIIHESARLLQDIVNFFPDPFFAIDAEGKVTVWNQAMEQLSGVKAGEIIGKGDYEYALPFYGCRRPLLADLALSYDSETVELYDKLLHIEDQTLTVETKVPMLDGKTLWAKAKPIYDRKGKIKGAVQSLRDITYRVQMEEQLKNTLSELEAVMEALPDLYLRLKADGTVLDIRAGYNAALDLDYARAVGKNLPEVFVPSINRALEQTLSEVIQTRKAGVTQFSCSNSDERYFQAHVVPLFGDQAVAVIRDVTEHHKYTKYLQEISLYDNLTKVHNRHAFQQELERIQTLSETFPMGIMVCDVDGLKLVNDVLGHLAGDRLLEVFAQLLKSCFENKAKIFRTGGDEFVAIFPLHDHQDMETRYAELYQAVDLYNSTNPDLPLSISAGVGLCQEPGPAVQDALERADNNMYQAKLRQYKGSHLYLKQTLMHALAERDFLAQGHGDRLQKTLLLLARAVGMPSSRLDDFRLMAYFHDIGKIRVPQHILMKPGPLTPEEKREVAKHCTVGHRIALSAPELVPIAEWILHHHERWDGSGYPLGLKETAIPLESRIFAIADAYDAITNDRPYRKARSSAEAVAELRACAGTQFDPELVNLFISVVLPAIESSFS